MATGGIFGPRLARLIARHVGLSDGELRGASVQRVNPPIPVRPALHHGKLDADLDCNAGLSTHATLSLWNDSADTGVDIEVYPPFAKPMGYLLAGFKVEAQWDQDAGHYVAVAGGKAREIRFTVKTAFTTSDSTITGTYVYGFDGDDPAGANQDITVENDGNAFRASAGAYGFARYNPDDDSYHAYQFSCVATGT